MIDLGVTPSVFESVLERGHNLRGLLDLRHPSTEDIVVRSSSNSHLSHCKRVASLLGDESQGLALNCVRGCKSFGDRNLRANDPERQKYEGVTLLAPLVRTSTQLRKPSGMSGRSCGGTMPSPKRKTKAAPLSNIAVQNALAEISRSPNKKLMSYARR